MSVLILCKACNFIIRVLGDDGDALVGRGSGFWPDGYLCVQCGKKAICTTEQQVDPRVLRVHGVRDLEAIEAFSALHGLGLPEEQDTDIAEVSRLFRETPVRRVHGRDVEGQKRAILDSVEFWDGTRMYFGASPEGTVVYRITRPHTYTERVLKELEKKT